jgi:hypothetical protein
MAKEFIVTINMETEKDIPIVDIQRIFRNFCFNEEHIKAFSVKSEVKKEQ